MESNHRYLIHIQAFWPLNYRRENYCGCYVKAHAQREQTARVDRLSTAIHPPIVVAWEWGVV